MIFKRNICLSLALGISLALQGCGDSYPETGKFQGNELVKPTHISKYSTVYALNSSAFEDWKEEYLKLKTLDNLSVSELVDLYGKVIQVPTLKTALGEGSLLLSDELDFDKQVETDYARIAGSIAELEERVTNAEKSVSAINEKKSNAEKASQSLDELRVKYESEEQALLDTFNGMKTEVAKIFSAFNKKEIGGRKEPFDVVLSGEPFDYIVYKGDKQLSCKEYAVKRNQWLSKYINDYIFSDPVVVEDKTYCPMFETLGSTEKRRKNVLSNMSEENIELIKKSIVANVLYKENKKLLGKKLRSINKDNPELYTTSKSFNYRDERQLSSLDNDIRRSKDEIAKLKTRTKDDIRTENAKHLADLLGRFKGYYLQDLLTSSLKQESSIQPDGTFTLRSGDDFYLVEVDLTDKKRPEAAEYALIRMDQYKNKDVVSLSMDEFFKFGDLASISL